MSAVLVASVVALAQPLQYPTTRKVDHTDTYHGTKVADPYRWLEDDTSAETAAWVEAENKVTFPYLERIPFRQQFQDRVKTLSNYERYSAPSRKGQYFFFSKNDGLQNQSALYIQKGLDGPPEVLIDPNSWSADGTTRLGMFAPSKDAKYAVYGISRSGSDWQQYKVMELATKKTLADTLDWVKVSGVAWHGDGFYYSRYPTPATGLEKAQEQLKPYKSIYHRVGTPQADDELVYHRPDQKEWGAFGAGGPMTSGYALHRRCRTAPTRRIVFFYATSAARRIPPVELLNDFDADYDFIDNDGPSCIRHRPRRAARTRHRHRHREARTQRTGAKSSRARADRFARALVRQRSSAATSKTPAAGADVYSHRRRARSRNVELPGLGTRGRFWRQAQRYRHSLLRFQLRRRPPTIYRYDSPRGTSTRLPRAQGAISTRRLRDQAGLLQQQRRHARADVHQPQEGPQARRQQSDAALRLRRLQHRARPEFQRLADRAGGDGRRLRHRRTCAAAANTARLARGRHEAEEAERLRRLHRRGRMADRQQVHVAAEARDSGRHQRRPARRRRHDAAARAVRRVASRRRRHGHAALPQVHDRLGLDRRLRLAATTRTNSRRSTPIRRFTTSSPARSIPRR